MAYFVLRGSMNDLDKRSRISAVYKYIRFCNAFSNHMDSTEVYMVNHCIQAGKAVREIPGLTQNDTSPEMEMVFLPAIIGWILLSLWITSLRIRLRIITGKEKKLMNSTRRRILQNFLNIIVFAQSMNNQTEDSTDFMRSEGKLYVVMAVVITIVFSIFHLSCKP